MKSVRFAYEQTAMNSCVSLRLTMGPNACLLEIKSCRVQWGIFLIVSNGRVKFLAHVILSIIPLILKHA